MRPYSANPMASTMLDLPAPVGPVSANRPAPGKPTWGGCRTAVTPSSWSRSGRRDVLQQLREQCRQSFVGDAVFGEVLGEQLVRRGSPPRLLWLACFVVSRALDHDIDRF